MKNLIPFAALAALMPLVPAQAEVSHNTTTVAFRDLDLASAKDRKALDLRIYRAAVEVCGAASDLDLTGQNDVRKCRTQTANAARTTVDTQVAQRNRTIQMAVAD